MARCSSILLGWNMALGKAFSAMVVGVEANIVEVEANIGVGLPGTHIVGLADTAIGESRERIRSAVNYANLPWPKTKIVVSLSPASLRKSGSHFDLAIALSVLGAASKDPETLARLRGSLVVGELGLDGSLRPIQGLLPILLAARDYGFSTVVVPEGNAAEASLVDAPIVLIGRNLPEVFAWAQGLSELPSVEYQSNERVRTSPDMADVAGQKEAKFGFEVAAAGGHHMMLLGPPGSGKSMLAARLPGLLPPLELQQCIEATTVHSVAGQSFLGPVRTAPFVAPHHSVTRAALLGGGSGNPKPGAVSLAHYGVLFLDEVSEIPANILDSLRTPLEDGCVRLVRARREVLFPARFQLVLAANPCHCGAEHAHECRCAASKRARYLQNISGPLRDRLDVFVRTHAQGAIFRDDAEPSAVIAERIALARDRAKRRFGCVNAAMNPHVLRREYPADDAAMAYLIAVLGDGKVSQRGVDRALKVAWTLCDLAGKVKPDLDHMAQALEFREGLQ
ncbi:Competence protein ComM [Corynebacterium freiburgense]|nr:Competence protein ComM [Corynebacterium freiburgense]